MSYLEDPSGTLTLNDVQSPSCAERFTSCAERQINFGVTRSVFWFRFSVRNTTDQPLSAVIELDNARLSSVKCFFCDDAGAVHVQRAGAAIPVREHAHRYDRPVFELDLKPHEERTGYLRIANNGWLLFRARLWDANAFERSNGAREMALSLLYGALLMMALHSILIYARLRDRSFLYSLFLALLCLLYEMSYHGTAHQYLWPSATWWSDRTVVFFMGLTMATAFACSRDFLNVRAISPVYNGLLFALILLSAGISVARLTDGTWLSALAHLVGSIGSVVVLLASLHCWRKGHRPALVFVFIWGMLVLSAVVFNLASGGFIPRSFVTENGFHLAITLAPMLFTLGLADRFRRLQLQYRSALETDVAERTRELRTEIAQHKRTEQALGESERKYRELVENANSIILRLDTEGRVTFFNEFAQRFYGYAEAEIRGKHVAGTIAPETETSVHLIQKMIGGVDRRAQPHMAIEYLNLCKDGRAVWVAWTTRQILDQSGRVVEVLCVGNDVTERKRAEEERRLLEARVQHTQKLESLGLLAGGIAHDFNNLLTAIIGNATLAQQEVSAVSPVHPMLDEIGIAARRAADLCRQLLAYSGKGRFVVQPVDLSELVREMGHILEVSISKKATLRYDLAEDLPAIEADATQIRQIVMNLIINASEAIGHAHGVVSVSTDARYCDRQYLLETELHEDLAEGEYVCLEVSDTGCGMDRGTVQKIFDPFFTTKFAGRGLGLAAVLGIVRGHRGAINVFSEPGKGTTFKLFFPGVNSAPGPIPVEPAAAPQWRGHGTILLVDDEDSVRTVAKKMLECIGFDVIMAADGLEGLHLFREQSRHIRGVLLDLTMPRMDGEETFRELRGIQAGVPVILSSGYSEQEIVARFASTGLQGFVQKPYEFSQLSAVMQQVFPE